MRRKLAVILASDVAGYSRLVAENEESTLSRFAKLKVAFSNLVASFHGRVFNTAGDAILAEFQSATDAVRCAIEIQDTVRARNLAFPENQRILFRIGIAIGDVMIHDEDLLGDGVNVAARLQTLAQPGGICISEEVYGHVGRNLSVSISDLGSQSLKNIPNPVRAFGIDLPGAAPSSPVDRPAGLGEAGAAAQSAPATTMPATLPQPPAAQTSRTPLLAGVAAAAFVVAAVGYWMISRGTQPPPPAPAVASAPPALAAPAPAAPPPAPVAAAPAPAIPPVAPAATTPEPTAAQPAPAQPPRPAGPVGESVQATAANLSAALRAAGVQTSQEALDRIVAAYLGIGEQKALFVGARGALQFSGGWTGLRDAETIAAEGCQIRAGEPCRLLARNTLIPADNSPDRLTPRPSVRVTYEGPFDPARIPTVTATVLRRPDVAGYGAQAAPKAMALHPSGRLAVAGGTDALAAEAAALAACNAEARTGGSLGPCFTYAVGDQVVLPQRRAEAR